MSKKHKVLLTVLVVGLGGAIAGFGVFSAFSSTTDNPGNTFEAGSVTISDNDGSTALFSNATKKGPGNTDRCIKVTYAGTLDSTVKLYASGLTGQADLAKLNVAIDKAAPTGPKPGTQADCSDFDSAAAASVYSSNTLTNFSGYTNFTNGLAVNPGAATKWVQNDAVVFRVRMTVPDLNASQGASITSFQLTWEAQNQ